MLLRSLFLLLIFLPNLAFSNDPHSYAQPENVLVTNIDLDLNIDVEQQTLEGTTTLTIDQKDKTSNLILDTANLKIKSIQIQENKNKWVQAKYTLSTADEILGSKLEIELPKNKITKMVRVQYSASKDAKALQWDTGEQTISRRPFLVTNSEPISARSFFPCQDTPMVRTTYSAKINLAQKDLMAVMSANINPTQVNSSGKYSFNMEIPVPSYLISLGVGKLVFKSTGPRTGIYAEPEMIDQAVKEFEDTEKMIQAGERLYGKYVWGRYDLLVLPANYPWGGMENPRLTFVTPTIITGKKDSKDIVAHEIAHSWSGNLVTNAQWSDLWINEGFATYIQYRIIGEMYGEQIQMMDMALDKIGLENDFLDKKNLKTEDTRLKSDFTSRSPEEAFSQVPYIKGSLFLYAIENKVGKIRVDEFLKNYFTKFSFKSVTTSQVIDELSGLVSRKYIDEWINKPGLPTDFVLSQPSIIKKIATMVTTFKFMGGAPNKKDIETMTSKEICYYLESLPKNAKAFKLQNIDSAFGFSNISDPEVRTQWYKLALPRKFKPAMETVPEFLSKTGRRKFVFPVYDALLKTKEGTTLATQVFEKNKMFYAPIVRNQIEKSINKINN